MCRTLKVNVIYCCYRGSSALGKCGRITGLICMALYCLSWVNVSHSLLTKALLFFKLLCTSVNNVNTEGVKGIVRKCTFKRKKKSRSNVKPSLYGTYTTRTAHMLIDLICRTKWWEDKCNCRRSCFNCIVWGFVYSVTSGCVESVLESYLSWTCSLWKTVALEWARVLSMHQIVPPFFLIPLLLSFT